MNKSLNSWLGIQGWKGVLALGQGLRVIKGSESARQLRGQMGGLSSRMAKARR